MSEGVAGIDLVEMRLLYRGTPVGVSWGFDRGLPLASLHFLPSESVFSLRPGQAEQIVFALNRLMGDGVESFSFCEVGR